MGYNSLLKDWRGHAGIQHQVAYLDSLVASHCQDYCLATPKLEPTVKEEVDEQDGDGPVADTCREELQNREEISQPDSEDSLGPEQVADGH